MGDGLRWLVEGEEWYFGVVFARGVTPGELAVRMGGVAGSVPSPVTGAQAWGVVMDDGTDDESVVRVGAYQGWSFALEYGIPGGVERLAEVSRGGVEAVRLDPQPDHPPRQFAYARDGVAVCSFGLGEEVWRWGSQPDFLLEELVRAGVLRPDGESARPEGEDGEDAERATLAVIEARFGLGLPRDVEEAALPAFVIR
ncbi:hypothetical protein BX285_6506 [Streptomyces sp. 1114.5]|uniref:DUF6461 domain-containing protein n=1 Tax=unclassified Streptomyces TaxID=2593676 RepID=UPI000BDC4DDA|nr:MULTISPECIES: DUF6461 domain-containing protein [unclassified Streptomyces]RKT09412.1 hypothetical protein BX285_6506 [Streptomyces sp. 1114.5]SOB88583.1 hypothetical protein SAMN06272789_6870 [Streptomyces sp. 1331.2]